MSRSEFVLRFQQPYWERKFGLFTADALFDSARELGLCETATAIRSFDQVRDLHENELTRGTFLLTDLKNQGGELVANRHCSLILGFQEEKDWVVWNPKADGTYTIEVLTDQYLDLIQSHFLVLL